MAAPSSSIGIPSPRPPYLQSTAIAPRAYPPVSTSVAIPDAFVTNAPEDRESLAKKITANARLSELVLNLRSRLLCATFKAHSNTASLTLQPLDSQLSAAGRQIPSGQRTASLPGSLSHNPAGQLLRSSARKASMHMAPPPPITASSAQSLFSYLLAPPPAKRARTIQNPEDLPVPSPQKVVEHAHSAPRPIKTIRTPDPRWQSKSKRTGKEKASTPRSGKGKGNGKQRFMADGSFKTAHSVEARKIDLEAAATLTTLLTEDRPSISATAGSPRSNIFAGLDPGSTHSFTQYAQSSARTALVGDTLASSSAQRLRFGTMTHSLATPLRSPELLQASLAMSHGLARRSNAIEAIGLRHESGGTSKTTPSDSVDDSAAAELLLHLATSPPLAHSSSRRDPEAHDAAAYRNLPGEAPA